MNVASWTLERKLCSPHGFGLTTASELQRNVCKLLDGRLAGTITQIAADVTGIRPRECAIVAGVRGGKSLIAACHVLHMSQIADCSQLGPGEIPRIPILSVRKDEAQVIFQHLIGRVRESVAFRHLLIGEPTAESCFLRHPTGRSIEVKIVAGARAGSSLTARWMAGGVFDEFPRMHGSEDGSVVNWSDSRAVVQPRLLPRTQILHIGSPWAPFGPAYEMVQKRFAHPASDLVVVRAPAYELNPHWWTPERVEEAKRLPSYRTDVLAEFASPEEMFFPADLLQRCVRPERLPEPRHTYVASMDPATRGNGWTLLVATRAGNVRKVVRALEWRGTESKPLSSREVLKAIAETLKPYGVSTVHTDQYMGDALTDLAREVGLTLIQWRPNERQRAEWFFSLRRWMEDGNLEIPDAILGDLVRVEKVPTTSGVSFRLPLTNDGRHCDFAPSLMLLAGQYLDDVKEQVAHVDPNAAQMFAAAKKRYGRRKGLDW